MPLVFGYLGNGRGKELPLSLNCMDLGSLKPEEMNLQFGDSPGKQRREDLSLTKWY